MAAIRCTSMPPEGPAEQPVGPLALLTTQLGHIVECQLVETGGQRRIRLTKRPRLQGIDRHVGRQMGHQRRITPAEPPCGVDAKEGGARCARLRTMRPQGQQHGHRLPLAAKTTRQLGRARRFEQTGQSERLSGRLFNAHHQLRRQQGVATEGKEVIVGADPRQPQYLGEEATEPLLQQGFRQ